MPRSWWQRLLNRTYEAGPAGATTRVTLVMYVDKNGEEGMLELPGWVGAVPHFPIDAMHVSGQAYMERPYSKPEDAPEDLTVADLRSSDGMH